MSTLDEIRTLADGFGGVLGVWAQSLDAGETIEWNADDSFPAASTIKVPILCEVFRQAGEGRFRLSDPITLRADDIVPGSGILKDLAPGLTRPVRDLATLMIVVSDNTATNAILTPQACADMLGILGRQRFTDNISRRLPEFDGYLETGKTPVVTVASKSGAIRGTRNGDTTPMPKWAQARWSVVGVQIKRWTREQYDTLVRHGVLGEDDRVQLIEGEIVEMAPQGHLLA